MKEKSTKTNKKTQPYIKNHADVSNFNFIVTGIPSKTCYVTFEKKRSEELHKKLTEITKNSDFYFDSVRISIESLYPFYLQFKDECDLGSVCLEDLVKLLEHVYKTELENVQRMTHDKVITFENLSQVFLPNLKIVGKISFGEKVGALIKRASYSHNGFYRTFDITATTNYTNGKSFIPKSVNFTIADFQGLKSFDSLPVKIMTSNDAKQLIEKGKIFAKFAIGHHYQAYVGNMFIESYYGPILFNGQGRIMIDVNSHSISSPNSYGYSYDGDIESHITELADDKLCMTWPFLPAFSLQAKQWGNIFLKNVSKIKFDDNAFDLLVLNEQKKNLTKILVTNASLGFTDIISDKSGGCIFLLHGPPGTGKTLTTESISELLHMPLYSVTSGELGVTPQEVEKTLQKILKLAQSWDAIILLDEADIFLQKRNNSDLTRNAIVGIFLRLLERYKGIMFLTTNRQTEIDLAFQSRITITFEYDDLKYYDKLQIWKNLLLASKINLSESFVKELAKYDINGRQIKNVIRLSHTLAINDKILANEDHFKQIASITGLKIATL